MGPPLRRARGVRWVRWHPSNGMAKARKHGGAHLCRRDRPVRFDHAVAPAARASGRALDERVLQHPADRGRLRADQVSGQRDGWRPAVAAAGQPLPDAGRDDLGRAADLGDALPRWRPVRSGHRDPAGQPLHPADAGRRPRLAVRRARGRAAALAGPARRHPVPGAVRLPRPAARQTGRGGAVRLLAAPDPAAARAVPRGQVRAPVPRRARLRAVDEPAPRVPPGDPGHRGGAGHQDQAPRGLDAAAGQRRAPGAPPRPHLPALRRAQAQGLPDSCRGVRAGPVVADDLRGHGRAGPGTGKGPDQPALRRPAGRTGGQPDPARAVHRHQRAARLAGPGRPNGRPSAYWYRRRRARPRRPGPAARGLRARCARPRRCHRTAAIT